MSDASLFLRKRKDKRRIPSARPNGSAPSPSAAAGIGTPPPVPPSGSHRLAQPGTNGVNGVNGVKRPVNGSASHDGPNDTGVGSSSGPRYDPSNSNLTVIKLFSTGPSPSTRYNLMKLNSPRDVDLKQVSNRAGPLLLNRKQPGPKPPPIYAYDAEGNFIGRYMYDDKGQPVRDGAGAHQIEPQDTPDAKLVGRGEVAGRKGKKGLKDVYSQDKEVMRLRREEAVPWVLETERRGEGVGPSAGGSDGLNASAGHNGTANATSGSSAEHWVGRMVEPGPLPSVMLLPTAEGFDVVTLGRTYRFDPERPFKVLDPDAAHKLVRLHSYQTSRCHFYFTARVVAPFEHQAKHKIHDRWAHRAGGPSAINTSIVHAGMAGLDIKPKIEMEGEMLIKQEERAARLEERMRAATSSHRGERGRDGAVKVERFDDDERREGRQRTRGMEGGVDEELDYDAAEDFQDDEDLNTFYRDAEEEEEAKAQEKKEYRLANANFGDKPQIEADMSDEEGLFGAQSLTKDGKRLKRIMRKRRGSEDLFDESDEDSDSSDDAAEKAKAEQSKAAEKAKEAEKVKALEAERNKPRSPSDRPSRPPSRGPNSRGTSSPTGRRPNPPPGGKAATAPPGSGASLVAQRATSRGASPRPSRAGSPLAGGRSGSPDAARAGVASRETSPRALSPPLSARGVSPGAASRGGSPAPSTAGGPSASGPGSGSGAGAGSKSKMKRPKKTDSPTPTPTFPPASSTAAPSSGPSGPSGPSNPSSGGGTPTKRKPSPSLGSPAQGSGSGPTADPPRKKKKSSSASATPTPAPEEITPFPGIITRDEVVGWFRSKQGRVPMQLAVTAFSKRIQATEKTRVDDNRRLFMHWVNLVTRKEVGGGGSLLILKEEHN